MANRSYDAQYEPRPGEDAGQEELRYQRFLRALRAAGLGNAERAEACAVAVLCTLEQRLTGPEARDLNFELPWALRDLLRRCELHPRARPEKIGRAEYLARVAEQLEVDEVQAEAIARTVLATARSFVSEKEAADVASQLPPDLETLWAPPA
ncbi:MAG TPA: DUF2267 domain-containing protein [Anaeromyxobacter sp.]|nr:DUF2267 domain-containing protein [Anaeromyxobacter sp.]